MVGSIGKLAGDLQHDSILRIFIIHARHLPRAELARSDELSRQQHKTVVPGIDNYAQECVFYRPARSFKHLKEATRREQEDARDLVLTIVPS